ncbi:alpha/beta hydrolase family protein [Chryseobacterium aquaticum]|uniref:Peptidase S9 prolyl oligopeptidase catalytic domain-containing protein n=1 Tax=Chryseobacterium aquaticum subsp. greenlandense TaxID=345663 RepID=A0A101CHJ5_9FLAO|nr:prolyl oligopeptidase family serine peptidase [Chryseobacterium aquaticum]KUJ56391.1 hypothetical protein AR686_07455 [Chryseobacterium aquaticum subsp. greenlandense]
MKILLILVILGCNHVVFSQNVDDTLQRKIYKNYDVNLKSTSLDGKWLSFYKLYDDNIDTLIVVNRENPIEQHQKLKVLDYKWSKDRLVLKYKDYTEVFDYIKNKHWNLPACENIGVINEDNLLALYNSDTVRVYDLKNEKLVEILVRVSKFFFRDNTVCLQIKNGEENELLELRKSGKTTLYKTTNDILNVKVLKNHSFLIFEKNEGLVQDIVYYNRLSKKISKFSQILNLKFNSATGYQRSDGSIIIDTETSKVRGLNINPEIWLSSDNNLLEKFKNSVLSKFLWLPDEKRLNKLGSEQLERVVDINNENYFLVFNSSEMQDYTTKQVSSKIYRFDKRTNHYEYVDTIKEEATYSPDGQYLIYKNNDFVKLLNINTLKYVKIKNKSFINAYFTDNQKIIFDGYEGLWEYDIKRSKYKLGYKNESGFYKIIKYDYSTNFPSFLLELNFRCRSLKDNNFVFEIYDQSNLVKSIYEKFNGKYFSLSKNVSSKLVYQKQDISKNSYLFTEENYNLPKQFISLSRFYEKKVIYQSNIGDKAQHNFRVETIHYKNSEDVNLKGTLNYPLDYNPAKKYPMIVHVYQIQSDKRNEYPVFLEQNITEGFNIRSLLERGYFVYMPDIVFDKKGTGLSAMDCINKSIDALTQNNSIDFEKVGLVGHSHGGYITNFIATHSNRFATYISGAGYSDIVRSYFSMSFHYMSPLYWQYENGQFDFKKSFFEDKELYFNNNPIYFVENVSKPVLLWTGKKDLNVEWGQSMEFYIGLKRNKKDATLLIYPDEGHYMTSSSNAKDLYIKNMEWLGYYLKGERKPSWIE